ncbi:peptidoglycan DD-metalloendopeptidase family protein [Solimonas marina]|uniref:Peptidoglycan DD-metalloendopeptidase family protein n=1 Tax=Solimonas marina TaxID=2714601 RepID=A0A969WC44_9GAMM|nr:peptidoglycan DD-metalloendopeptidase family protein [Solimonas marina]NKF24467.1 peptidoglycan DD-metalloendopeptidase family protein [Solimonas marina]
MIRAKKPWRSLGWVPALILAMVLQGCAGWSSWENSRRVSGHHREPLPAGVVPDRMPGPQEYVVRPGDTVYAIAFRNDVDYHALARWNGIDSDYLIHPGEVLRLRAPPATSSTPPRQQVGVMQTQALSDATSVTATPVTADTPPPQTVTAPSKPPPSSPASDVDDGPAGGYQWMWPVDHATVMRGFGQQGSKGVDFTGKVGQPVFAAAPGRVVYSGNALKGYGELIIIKHDDVYLSAYGYNRKRYVKEGDIVTAGQPIGEMGLGPENKPMLHFEIREKGEPINPAKKLPAKVSAPSR